MYELIVKWVMSKDDQHNSINIKHEAKYDQQLGKSPMMATP